MKDRYAMPLMVGGVLLMISSIVFLKSALDFGLPSTLAFFGLFFGGLFMTVPAMSNLLDDLDRGRRTRP